MHFSPHGSYILPCPLTQIQVVVILTFRKLVALLHLLILREGEMMAPKVGSHLQSALLPGELNPWIPHCSLCLLALVCSFTMYETTKEKVSKRAKQET